VRARRLRLSPLAVGASLRIVDSLPAGISHFYAEVKRLRELNELTDGPLPALLLLDEIFHGTNSHDRRLGASAVLRKLVDAGALALVTTHDLALAELAEGIGSRARNVHFEDQVQEGRMVFDFQMRPGVAGQGNALRILESEGLLEASDLELPDLADPD
jgi:DNA mismatch repair ATPase MutS